MLIYNVMLWSLLSSCGSKRTVVSTSTSDETEHLHRCPSEESGVQPKTISGHAQGHPSLPRESRRVPQHHCPHPTLLDAWRTSRPHGFSARCGQSGKLSYTESNYSQHSSENNYSPGSHKRPLSLSYRTDIEEIARQRWHHLKHMDLHTHLHALLGPTAEFRGIKLPVLTAITQGHNPILAVMKIDIISPV